ncbi:tetratricopeptide repeat protein [candidate division KSB1 bacterium]
MLDQQFFSVEKYHKYLKNTFIPLHALRGEALGDVLYEEYGVTGTPTVMITMADGSEINRVVGYGSTIGGDKYKDRLEEAYKGEDTIFNMKTALEGNPENIDMAVKLMEKQYSQANRRGAADAAENILKYPDKAKEKIVPVKLSYRDEPKDLSAYEYARYMSGYRNVEKAVSFLKDFPESKILNNAISNFSGCLYYEETEVDALKHFDEVLSMFPDSESLIFSFISFSGRSKKHTYKAMKLADEFLRKQTGKINRTFALYYYPPLLEATGELMLLDGLKARYEKDYPTDNSFGTQEAYALHDEGKFEEAIATWERNLRRNPEDWPSYYQLGRTAAVSGIHLDRGEECLSIYMAKTDKERVQPSHAAAYWRLGNIYEKKDDPDKAMETYEACLKLDPKYENALKDLARLKEKK